MSFTCLRTKHLLTYTAEHITLWPMTGRITSKTTRDVPLVHCPTCSFLLLLSICQIAHNFLNSSVTTSDYVNGDIRTDIFNQETRSLSKIKIDYRILKIIKFAVKKNSTKQSRSLSTYFCSCFCFPERSFSLTPWGKFLLRIHLHTYLLTYLLHEAKSLLRS
jgi:hypothetical protein